MMGDAAAGTMLCDGCGHAHATTETCPRCGHAGRTIGMPGPGDRQPPPPTFWSVSFDSQTKPESLTRGYYALAKILRTRVFVQELKEMKIFPKGVDQDSDAHELKSRHVLGLIGDAPVAYVRWRFVPASHVDGAVPGVDTSSSAAIFIDRFLVLKEYRGRKYGIRILTAALSDIAHAAAMLPHVVISKACIFCPGVAAFLPAAKACLHCHMSAVTYPGADPSQGGMRPRDPSGFFPEHVPVMEFAIAGSSLPAFAAIAQQAGAAAAAAAAAPAGAVGAAPGLGYGAYPGAVPPGAI